MKRRSRGHLAIVTLFLVTLVTVAGGAHAAKKKEPDSSQAQLEFGVEMAKRGLWSEALFRFKRAQGLDPGNPRILNNLAVAFEALGNFEKALEIYQDAIRSDPANKELKRNYSRFVEFYRAYKPDQQQSTETQQASAQSPSGP